MEHDMDHVIERIEELRSVDIFKSVEIDILYQVMKVARYVRFKKNELVVKKGSFEQHTYIVMEGKVGIFLHSADSIPVCVGVGGVFGEVGIINSDEEVVVVKTLEDSLLLEFAEHTFVNLLKRSNEMAFALLRVLIHNLRLADENR